MTDEGYLDHVDKVFINKEDADKYIDGVFECWVEEHEVIE